MHECRKGVYANNKVIKSIPFTCFGGAGCKPCEYLRECVAEHNMKVSKKNRLIL